MSRKNDSNQKAQMQKCSVNAGFHLLVISNSTECFCGIIWDTIIANFPQIRQFLTKFSLWKISLFFIVSKVLKIELLRRCFKLYHKNTRFETRKTSFNPGARSWFQIIPQKHSVWNHKNIIVAIAPKSFKLYHKNTRFETRLKFLEKCLN